MSDILLRKVVDVKPLGEHRLRLRFDDGVEGELDFSKWLTFRGVFEPLKDPEYFSRVRADRDFGTLSWPNDVDLDPAVLYSRVTGEPIPDFGEDAVTEDSENPPWTRP